MNTTSPEKPFDLLCVEESELLKNNIITIVQNSKLPISVTRLILVETYRELLTAIDQTLTKQSQDYYTKLSEATSTADLSASSDPQSITTSTPAPTED